MIFNTLNKTRRQWRWHYNLPRLYQAARLGLKFTSWKWFALGWYMFGPIDE